MGYSGPRVVPPLPSALIRGSTSFVFTQPWLCRRHSCRLAIVLTIALWEGCAMFPNLALSRMSELQPHSPPPVGPQDAVQLELFFIERPPDDPLVGDPLWTELDQIGNVAPETRARLTSNGLRFGLAGANLPYALRALITAGADGGAGRRTLRQEYQMPSGISHLFPCGRLPDPATVEINTDGTLRERQYHTARGVLRCRVERSQPGWATVEVLPEIHHGQLRMRPQATDEEWDWGGGQEVDSLYGLRFSVELNEGESLVLGAVGENPRSVGHHFFRVPEQHEPVEKLLVIRLSRIDQVRPVLQTNR